MIKKLLIALVLVGLGGFVMQTSTVYAQNPPPGESLESETFMFDLSTVTHEAIEGSTRQGWIRGGVNYFFERIIGFMAAIIGSLAVLMLSVGGFMIIYSGGNEEKRGKGMNYVKYSLIGLGVTLLAYVMVTLVQLLISSIYA